MCPTLTLVLKSRSFFLIYASGGASFQTSTSLLCSSCEELSRLLSIYTTITLPPLFPLSVLKQEHFKTLLETISITCSLSLKTPSGACSPSPVLTWSLSAPSLVIPERLGAGLFSIGDSESTRTATGGRAIPLPQSWGEPVHLQQQQQHMFSYHQDNGTWCDRPYAPQS